ncbi:MAG: thermonuclease family protein [Planctomycetia bacterium]
MALLACATGVMGCGEGDAPWGPGRDTAAGRAEGAAGHGAPTFTGEVVAVTDGDTLRVMHAGREERIRLYGVDAPERAQPYSQRAKQLASSLVFGKAVQVQVLDTDRYGRSVARVLLADGRDLGHELVQAGLAWWYEQFARDDRALAALEQEARRARRGLWADASPQPPWEYRRQRKEAG